MADSGTIDLDGDVIRYRSKTYGTWVLSLADVRVIGECTNDSGPFADDYFLCFATGPGPWHEASFYAGGCDVFIRTLESRLGTALGLALANSTDFASRVLWPPPLTGEPMFTYTDVPAQGLFARLFGTPRNRQTYSDRVAAMLAGK